MPKHIKEIIARRNDLSTFVVHLTKDTSDQNSAKANLTSIINQGRIHAHNIFGYAASLARKCPEAGISQKTVCFTETPLEHLNLFLEDIGNRQCHFKPYGIAITKKLARSLGVNPVWYVDRNTELGKSMQTFMSQIISSFDSEDPNGFFNLTPYIESIGQTETNKTIEFWWEREWRKVGDFSLPYRYIVICPEEDMETFWKLTTTKDTNSGLPCIDPAWGLEQIIASLAGYSKSDIEIL